MTAEPQSGMEAALAKIQGGVDLIAERLLHSNQINDERHTAVREDIRDIRDGHHRLSNRVGILEAHKSLSEGERKGLTSAGRLAWAAIGALPMGALVAALMKAFGA